MERKFKPIPYKEDEEGTISFERKDIEMEIPAEVGPNAMVYIGTEMVGRKVRIFLMRDKSPNKTQKVKRGRGRPPKNPKLEPVETCEC